MSSDHSNGSGGEGSGPSSSSRPGTVTGGEEEGKKGILENMGERKRDGEGGKSVNLITIQSHLINELHV